MTTIGELDTEVTLQRAVVGDSRTGQRQTTYADHSKPWAKVKHLGTRDVARYRQAQMRAQVEVTIRYEPDVETDWHVVIDGKEYHVESFTHDGRRFTTLGVYRLGK